MADSAVVRQITIQGRVDGVDQATASLQNMSGAQQRVIEVTNQLRQSIDQATLALNGNVDNLNKLKSANDNVSSSYLDVVNSAKEVSGGLAETVENVLNTINHLKLLALAAYAISPAFRSVVSSGVSTAFKEIPVAADLGAQAMGKFVSVASPALSFFARMTVPIAAAVLAWKGLNYIIDEGSGLLDKYTDAQRKMFEPDSDSQLKKLNRFQNDGDLSLQQVQTATDLAARLKEAKSEISDFFKVQIDTTDAALKLQAAWVGIVEAIASATNALSNLGSMLSGWLDKFGNLSIWNVIAKIPIPGPPGMLTPVASLPAQPDQDAATQMQLARARLASAMGGGFAGRFAGDISSLANPPAADATKGPNSLDRFNDSLISQIAQLQEQADGAGKTSQAVEELKVAHEGYVAATKAGIPITDQMKESWKASADQIAALNIQLRQTQALQSETFKSQTMFMSPGDAAAASVAHQIDPTNFAAHMNDTAAQMAKYNTDIGQARDLTVSFGDSVADAMLKGGNTIRSVLLPALQSLETSLLNLMVKVGVNSLYGLFAPAGAPGSASSVQAQNNIIGSAFGNIFSGGHVVPLAMGGIVTAPTLFPMAGGAGLMGEAGPEAVVPLSRGADGRLGISGGGSNVNVVVNNNHAGAGVDVSHQKRSDGGVDMVMTVKNIMSQHAAAGGLDGVMRSRYGMQIRPQPR